MGPRPVAAMFAVAAAAAAVLVPVSRQPAEADASRDCTSVRGRVELDTSTGTGDGRLRAGRSALGVELTSTAGDDETFEQRYTLDVGPYLDAVETPIWQRTFRNGVTRFVSRAEVVGGGEGNLWYAGRIADGVARFRLFGFVCGWGPTLVLHGAAVHTVTGGTEEAVAVQGDRIIAVGSTSDVMKSVVPGSTPRMVDLGGTGSVVPGFVDSHSHRLEWSIREGLPFVAIEQRAFEQGVTTVGEPSQNYDQIDTIAGRGAAGDLRLRIRMWPAFNTVCGDPIGPLGAPEYTRFTPSQDPAPMFGIPGMKIFADGGVCNTPAISFTYRAGVDPLPPEVIGSMGDLYLTEAELTAAAVDASARGYQVIVHAIGDRGLETTLAALATTIGTDGNPLRHRIEHNVLVRPELIPTYVEHDIGAVVFGEYPTCRHNTGGWWAQHLAPEQIPWLHPFRDMADAGVDLAWQADFESFTDDSMLQWWGLVTLGGSEVDPATGDRVLCDAPPELASHGLTTSEALAAMTINAARQTHLDAVVGSIEVGKVADLVVLSTDPIAATPAVIPGTVVETTFASGEIVHCVPGAAACS